MSRSNLGDNTGSVLSDIQHYTSSSFVAELQKDPVYGVVAATGAAQETHECGECGGRLIGVNGQDGRVWYRCEHVQHCGNLLPACAACGSSLPRRAKEATEVQCGCGASYPDCPECTDGWLVERSGPYGQFLGCVRFPACSGKSRPSSSRQSQNKLSNTVNCGRE